MFSHAYWSCPRRLPHEARSETKDCVRPTTPARAQAVHGPFWLAEAGPSLDAHGRPLPGYCRPIGRSGSPNSGDALLYYWFCIVNSGDALLYYWFCIVEAASSRFESRGWKPRLHFEFRGRLTLLLVLNSGDGRISGVALLANLVNSGYIRVAHYSTLWLALGPSRARLSGKSRMRGLWRAWHLRK